jgi:hypothetical protein
MSIALPFCSLPLNQPRRFARAGSPWFVLLLCILLTGCSATRLAYNQLDWLIVWYLNGFFTLNEAQETQLHESVTRNLEWHRTTQLPKYAVFCRELDQEMAGTLSSEILQRRYERMTGLWDEFLLQALPDVSAFFLSLDQAQIDEFIENLEENNEELWEEFAGESADERLERREKQAIKGIQRAVGRLTGEQKELVRAYMANMHDVSVEWMEGRKAWQSDFHTLILNRLPEPAFTERLTKLMIDPNRQDSTNYRVKVAENRKTLFAMFTALAEQFSVKQRARLSTRLNNYAEDFEILALQDQ